MEGCVLSSRRRIARLAESPPSLFALEQIRTERISGAGDFLCRSEVLSQLSLCGLPGEKMRATVKNTSFTLPPINRTAPITTTRMTATISAYSPILWASSAQQRRNRLKSFQDGIRIRTC